MRKTVSIALFNINVITSFTTKKKIDHRNKKIIIPKTRSQSFDK